MTYPDATVGRFIDQHFIPVKVLPLETENHAIVKRYGQVWTPTILVLDAEGQAVDEFNGYLPPSLFVPRLLLGLGKAALKRDEFEAAAACFDEIVNNHPLTDVAPEACYWAAVSRYKGSHQADDLLGGWRELQARYPESVWRIKQSFIEG